MSGEDNIMKNSTDIQFQDTLVTTEELSYGVSVSGQLPRIVKEILLNRILEGTEINDQEKDLAVDDFCKDNNLDTGEDIEMYKKKRYLNQREFEIIATRGKKIVKFREEKWGNLVNSIFLQKKEIYDSIIYKCFTSRNFNLMQEVYFRIKDDGISWDVLAKQLDFKDKYLVGPIRVKKMHSDIHEVLRKAVVGKINTPTVIDQQTIVTELVEIIPAKMDEQLRAEILRDEFESWFNQQLITSINSLIKI